ncbi:hypothetical protein Syun_030228 [Stephania yunnanensis]|uniref:Uncharacterized protein n=1 Tax=Stephania yunnanensis TaxID=152371 RepID=A0AAP0EFF4_9MAGN
MSSKGGSLSAIYPGRDREMKELWDTVVGADSEDDQEGVRIMDDVNFIDDTGVDPADRYDSDNEGFIGDAPRLRRATELESLLIFCLAKRALTIRSQAARRVDETKSRAISTYARRRSRFTLIRRREREQLAELCVSRDPWPWGRAALARAARGLPVREPREKRLSSARERTERHVREPHERAAQSLRLRTSPPKSPPPLCLRQFVVHHFEFLRYPEIQIWANRASICMSCSGFD